MLRSRKNLSTTVAVENGPKGDLVRIVGPMSDEVRAPLFSLLSRKLGKKCTINFREVAWIDSSGTRAWLLFIKEFAEGREIFLEECTPDIMMTIGMVPSFISGCQVTSAYGRYYCEPCRVSLSVLFDTAKLQDDQLVPPQICPTCSQAMLFDYEPEDYFSVILPRAG
jgi:hypothetical protein